MCKKIIRRKNQVAKHELIVLNGFSERVKILLVLFTKNTVKPVYDDHSWNHSKVVVLGSGRLIKHLCKTTTNQIWSVLAGF